MSSKWAERRQVRRRRGATTFLATLGLAVALVGCNYTGDMNVQPSKGAYNAAPIRQPLADPKDSAVNRPARSVPVNPTPENFFGTPLRPDSAPPRAASVGRPQAEGITTHPYVGAPVPLIDERNGTPNSQTSIDNGAKLFRDTCAACHGVTGAGNGVVGAWFARAPVNKPPANLTSAEIQAKPDAEFYTTIKNGYGAMPAISYELQPSEIWDVIHYVRTLRR